MGLHSIEARAVDELYSTLMNSEVLIYYAFTIYNSLVPETSKKINIMLKLL